MLVPEHVAAVGRLEKKFGMHDAVEEDEELRAGNERRCEHDERREVVKLAQAGSGMRQKVMPSARIVLMVTRKFRAVTIELAPAHWTPMLKKTWPSG